MKKIMLFLVVIFNLFTIKVMGSENLLKSKLLFNVDNDWNMQGLEYYEENFIIGYDRGKGNGIIEIRNKEGKVLRRSDLLRIGHSSELVVNKNNGKLYVSNGGGNTGTKIYEIDLKDNINVEREYDFSELGNSGLVTIDQEKNNFIIHTAKDDKGSHKFTICGLNKEEIKSFNIDNIGVPQGIQYLNGKIYFYTNDKVTVIDVEKEIILQEYNIEEKGESEGLAIEREENGIKLYYGYNKGNRIYEATIKEE